MNRTIKGMASNMCHQQYPTKYVASDGTRFGVARVYNVSSRNLCVERIDPDGDITLYADTLYAVPEIAESKACGACRAYEASLPESKEQFPLRLHNTKRVASFLLADLGYACNSNGDRISDYFSLVERTDGTNDYAAVCLTEEIKDLPPEDHGYMVHLVDDVTGADCAIYHTDEMTRESLVSLLNEITDGIIQSLAGADTKGATK